MSQPALIRLMSWLSPVFPTGSFAYSAGLEQAVAGGLVTDEASLNGWLQAQLAHGSPWNDAVLLAAGWHAAADAAALASLAELATALSGSAERNGETLAQGRSFLEAAAHWFPAGTLPLDGASAPLPVAIGAAARTAGIALDQALAAWLQAFISNQLQAAIRLSVTGQNGAARLLAALEPAIAAAADRATRSTPDDLGSFAFTAEIASMKHETLQPRLFLS